MHEEVTFGLIGASDIARTRMIPAMRENGCRIAGVVSSNGEHGEAFAREAGVARVHGAPSELLADPEIDAVYVSTFNGRHCEAVLAAAKAGKHVLCEKPLALCTTDAERMIEACREAGVVLGTNHHLRNAATHITLRRLVAEGRIGRVLAARVFHAVELPQRLHGWRTEHDKGGGVIADITVHDVDTLRFVLDDELVAVTALAHDPGGAKAGVEDAVMGVMELSRGTLVQFHDAFTVAHATTGLELLGSEGSLVGVDVMTQDPVGTIALRRRGLADEEIPLGEYEDLYVRGVRRFCEAVAGRGEPAATGEDGLASLAGAAAVKQSTLDGAVVRLDRGSAPRPLALHSR